MKKTIIVVLLALSWLFFRQSPSDAAALTFVSDTINQSAPEVLAKHSLKFTTASTIPASGKIIITPQEMAFTIPAGLDQTDLQFFVNDISQVLAVSPGTSAGSALGVTVTSGPAGKIVFTLNNADVIAAGSQLLIKINSLNNPAAAGSYRVRLATQNASNSVLDQADAMVAIVEPVTVNASKVKAPPPVAAPSAPPVVGGGGRPLLPPAPPPASAEVVLKGKAYPRSAVTILKDGQIAARTIADQNADFEFSLKNLSAGSYNFVIYAEDRLRRRSPFFSFPVLTTLGATVFRSGLLIAPTIAIDKIEARRGDTVAISGQSLPQAAVTIFVSADQERIFQTKTDKGGSYLYILETTSLAAGDYAVKTQARTDTLISPVSQIVGFKINARTIPKLALEKFPPKVDLNQDGKINLIDFSILVYWYKRPLTEAARSRIDLNNDGRVDLVDFSILAYYWTG